MNESPNNSVKVLQFEIAHLGGTASIRGMVDATREVCNQWK
ncbi:hypothetical protein ACKFKG_08860 [Phormidesmis sp. 146-35]